MADQGSSVTLILYRVGDKWWREPALNLVAAAAQFSAYTHIEIAIGEVRHFFKPMHAPVSHKTPIFCTGRRARRRDDQRCPRV